MTRVRALMVALIPAVLAAGCTPGRAAEPATDLVVFAASSLDGPFTRLGRVFEAEHPGVRVRFSFDGSSALVDQLSQGASADLFASADAPTMARAVAAGLIAGTPERFASNELILIVPAGNPAGVTGLDGSLAGRKLVVCAAVVPCGSATLKLASLLGVTLHPVSEETRVSDVRAKVETGQADAGVVYFTDATASGAKVEVVPLPRADEARNDYLFGVTARAEQPDLAAAFGALVTGDQGEQVLAAAGFGR